MMLHCASRMNFLSYVFQQRHQIALVLGIIDEIPISTCHHAYEFDQGLKIITTDDQNSNIPPVLSQAKEINLFCQEAFFKLNLDRKLSDTSHATTFCPRKYPTPEFSVFHPPA